MFANRKLTKIFWSK